MAACASSIPSFCRTSVRDETEKAWKEKALHPAERLAAPFLATSSWIARSERLEPTPALTRSIGRLL